MNAILEPAPQKANFTNIARHLTDAITSGHFGVGTLLPTELELCKHYGTSRHTVRAALAETAAARAGVAAQECRHAGRIRQAEDQLPAVAGIGR